MDLILPQVRLLLLPLILNRGSNSFKLRIYFTDFTFPSMMSFLPTSSSQLSKSSSQSSPCNHVESLSHASTSSSQSSSESDEASKKRKKKTSINVPHSIDLDHIYQISSNEDGKNTQKLIS